MPDRFYTPQPLAVGEFTLDGPDAYHLAAVLRARPGQAVTLFNGDGDEYACEILAVSKRTVTIHVQQRCVINRERTVEITIAAAMPKGDRGDWIIEKLTELGVTRFVPLITERTVVIPKASRLESLRRTVIESSKQCGRNRLMVIEEPVRWVEFAQRDGLPGRKYLLHPVEKPERPCADEATVFAIGPEGGFTDKELADGWTKLTLGPRILRIETAAIVAASALPF